MSIALEELAGELVSSHPAALYTLMEWAFKYPGWWGSNSEII